MPWPFDKTDLILGQRPSRSTGTMNDWTNWVEGLTRHERDLLYPGMHKDLIPAYEIITPKLSQPSAGMQNVNMDSRPAEGFFGYARAGRPWENRIIKKTLLRV